VKWRALVAAFAIFAFERSASADGARLVYERADGAESCPDERALRELVAQKVGRDPFDGDDAVVTALVRRSGGEIVADVQIDDERAGVHGKRRLASKGPSCDELASALVVTISIALDPARFGAKKVDAPPPPPPPPPPATRAEDPFAEPPRPPPPPPAREPLTWRAAAAGGASFGVAPAPALALLVSVGGRYRALSLDLEGRLHPAASEGRVSASSTWAALVPCVTFDPLSLCAPIALGVVRGRGEGVASPSTDSSFAAAAGLRAAVEVPLAPVFGVRAGADAMMTIHGTRLLVDGQEAWATPLVWASAWAGAVVHFR
jgi:hypothetical protein